MQHEKSFPYSVCHILGDAIGDGYAERIAEKHLLGTRTHRRLGQLHRTIVPGYQLDGDAQPVVPVHAHNERGQQLCVDLVEINLADEGSSAVVDRAQELGEYFARCSLVALDEEIVHTHSACSLGHDRCEQAGYRQLCFCQQARIAEHVRKDKSEHVIVQCSKKVRAAEFAPLEIDK